jgi:hypothetical protein
MLTKEQKLAREIADALNDMEALTVYESFTEKYKEEFLRRILQRVLSVPQDQIRKTRGALFTYLIKQHGGQGGSWN